MSKLLILLILMPITSKAVDVILSPEETQAYSPGTCTFGAGDCGLKKFKISSQNYKLQVGGIWRFGTRAFISIETNTIDQIRSYGVVQFIRGCVYNSKLADDGKVKKEIKISREFYNDYQLFSHPEWVIDSIDLDPLCNSFNPEMDRFGAYRWSPTPGVFTNYDEQVYLLERAPEYPEIYVTDRPAQAFYENGKAKNVSLQFNTCLYESKDIPLVSKPTELNFADPIKCFKWNSQFKFNHKTKVFEETNSIDDICLK